MTDHLRRISVHVDEPEPGRFHWVVMEEGDDRSVWVELNSSMETFDAWIDALTAGCDALTDYAGDVQIGPRRLGEDEDASPVGS